MACVVCPATQKNRDPQVPMGFITGKSRSGVQDAQLERLADRLRTVHDVEFPQDLLHVVLHGERADLQDRADLEVRLAEVDPLEDVHLSYCKDAAAARLVAVGLGALGELRADPGGVQRWG